MKKKIILLFLVTAVVFFSCQKEKEEIINNVNSITSKLTNEEIKSLLRLKGNHSISLEEAKMQALEITAILNNLKVD